MCRLESNGPSVKGIILLKLNLSNSQIIF